MVEDILLYIANPKIMPVSDSQEILLEWWANCSLGRGPGRLF